jgi:hypothetical protein
MVDKNVFDNLFSIRILTPLNLKRKNNIEKEVDCGRYTNPEIRVFQP